jgi:DNA-binding transcriptional ArsR family regulator
VAKPKKKRPESERKVKKGVEILDPRLAKALANSQRVEILAVLSHRQISPVAYVREYGGKLPSVAYHFKVLEHYECIELAETVKRRGALEHVYRCAKRPLLGDGDWKLLPLAVRGGISGAILRTLVERARLAIEEGTFDRREDRHFTWSPLSLDQKGWKEVTSLLASTLAKVEKVQVKANGRMAKSGEEAAPITVALASFESPAEAPA